MRAVHVHHASLAVLTAVGRPAAWQAEMGLFVTMQTVFVSHVYHASRTMLSAMCSFAAWQAVFWTFVAQFASLANQIHHASLAVFTAGSPSPARHSESCIFVA